MVSISTLFLKKKNGSLSGSLARSRYDTLSNNKTNLRKRERWLLTVGNAALSVR